MPTLFSVDISEDALHNLLKEETFDILLRDHTRKDIAQIQTQSKIEDKACDAYHIIWATKDYERLGAGYGEQDMITAQAILGNRHMIVPRSVKDPAIQKFRTQDKAEVFTPSWICNAQNNLIDEAWFGRADVFNTVSENGRQWQATTEKITFPEGRTWQDYVSDPRLEITCGEAPYLVSRYDPTNGEFISIERRIGIFDRKMRVVNENTDNETDWIAATRKALESSYGYEWQGDSLFLARENMMVSVIEYYQHKFKDKQLPPKFKNGKDPLNAFAYIISWNIWQMDGLKQTLPYFDNDKLLAAYWEARNKQKNNSNDLFSKIGEDNITHFAQQIPFCRIRRWPKLGDSGKGEKELFVESIQD